MYQKLLRLPELPHTNLSVESLEHIDTIILSELATYEYLALLL